MKMLTGDERFEAGGKPLALTMLDFWRYSFSNIFDIQGDIAEFVVAKALGLDEPYNKDCWTLYDIPYRGRRVEIKETSYYHSFTEPGKVSRQRIFGIGKANSAYEDQSKENVFERQNDVYIFCVINGDDPESGYTLNLDNWDFYVVPTTVINEKCGEQKTISLKRIQNFGYAPVPYEQLKGELDRLIDDGSIPGRRTDNEHR